MLNKILTTLLLLIGISVKGQNVDRIVAVIGDKIILWSDINNQIRQAKQEGVTLGPNPECTILEETMFQKLLVHQADIDSLVVSEDAVESELDQRLNYFIGQIGSKEKFEEYYGKTVDKFKDDFRDGIRDRMKAQQMQSKITGDIKVTPKEVRDFFNAIPKDSIPFMGSKIEMAHLVIIPKVTAEQKQGIRDKLNKIRTDLLEGKESFCGMAFEYSDDPGTRNNCGEFDLVPRGTFVPEFDATAFSMKEGQISEIFETAYGYHILQLLERRGDLYRGRHILIAPKLSNAQMAEASQKLDSIYKDIINKKISFEDAVLKYSTDEETKYNGGKIFNPQTGDSKFENNQIDKQIFIAVDRMNPGDVSEPVFMTTQDNKQGIRIIKLLSRSEPHIASLKEDYPQISEAATNDKRTKAMLKWIKTKTTSMYVWVDEESRACKFEYPWLKNQ